MESDNQEAVNSQGRVYADEFSPQSWSEFVETIDHIRNVLHAPRQDRVPDSDETVTQEFDIVFRGHGDFTWKLQTTLERAIETPVGVASYISDAYSVRNELESTLERFFDLPEESKIRERIMDGNLCRRYAELVISDLYSYFVYLRHHGFPSPLLDWSISPYIAAYFAVESMAISKDGAVIALVDSPKGYRFGGLNGPSIKLWGPYLTTHKRHFTQQARYTTAIRERENKGGFEFCSHESIVENNPSQVALYRIRIPWSLRKDFLIHLAEFNINSHTLYQSEDSLVRWLGIKTYAIDWK